MRTLLIGFHNYVPLARITGVFDYLDRPNGLSEVRRKADAAGLLVAATHGRRTRSLIVMDSGHVVLSAITAETLRERMEAQDGQ